MGMNNWGGVTEHMTKKPRKFFGNKRFRQKFSHNPIELNETQLKKADSKRKFTFIKEVLLILFISMVLYILHSYLT